VNVDDPLLRAEEQIESDAFDDGAFEGRDSAAASPGLVVLGPRTWQQETNDNYHPKE
jgi:hypothetical protein